MSAIHVHITNTMNLPAEALENEYSLLVEEYGIVEDSGGSGRMRGGLGIARQIRALQDGTIFSVRSDGHVIAAEGLAGGGPGGTAKLYKNPGTAGHRRCCIPRRRMWCSHAGEAIRLETPGGGGFGPPSERPLEELARDLRDDVLSLEKARRDYGAERVEAALHLDPGKIARVTATDTEIAVIGGGLVGSAIGWGWRASATASRSSTRATSRIARRGRISR